MSEPKGPVYLTVPMETAMLPLPGRIRFPTRDQLGLARPVWPDPADARRAAQWLLDADNPCIYTAKSGRNPESVEALVRLAELLALPVMDTARLDRLRRHLLEIGKPVFLVSGRANIRYLSGFTGSAGWLLVAPDRATLFTDGRYDIQSRQQTSGIEINISHGNAMPAVVEFVKKGRLRQIAFERNRASYNEFQLLKESLPRRRFVPLDAARLLHERRSGS